MELTVNCTNKYVLRSRDFCPFLGFHEPCFVRWCVALFIFYEEKLLKCEEQSEIMHILQDRIVVLSDFDDLENIAHNRLKNLSRKYVESIRQRVLRSEHYKD